MVAKTSSHIAALRKHKATLDIPRTPTQDLTGKRAIITGANGGLGFACAAALAQVGAEVFLLARNGKTLRAAEDAINQSGGKAHSVIADINDVAAMKSALDEIPLCSILVNNAGINRLANFVDVTEEDFDAIFNINVRASFFMAQEVAKRLVAAKQPGSIINISSQMGYVGGNQRSVYCASKHAMEGFTKAMAWELGPHNIRANTICPTFFATPLTKPMFEDKEFMQEVLAKIALKRVGEPQDIMAAVVFLAADGSAMITGSALKIDGGWTAV